MLLLLYILHHNMHTMSPKVLGFCYTVMMELDHQHCGLDPTGSSLRCSVLFELELKIGDSCKLFDSFVLEVEPPAAGAETQR